MTFKFDKAHVAYLALLASIVGLTTWDHFSGSPLTPAIAWKMGAFVLLSLLMLAKRSPADLASVLSGQLVDILRGLPPALARRAGPAAAVERKLEDFEREIAELEMALARRRAAYAALLGAPTEEKRS